MAGLAVVAAGLLTVLWPTVLLVLTPLVLLPAGLYQIANADAARARYGLDVERTGWLSFMTGLVAATVALLYLLLPR